jgi:hypothetical protein
MNLLLKIAQIYIPGFIKKKKLLELFEITAQAFQCDVPGLKGNSYDDFLKDYAEFTKTKAEEALRRHHELEAIKKRLYQNAYQLGQKLKKDFRIKSSADVMTMSKILYQMLGIEFQGNLAGDVVIKRCFFSQFYSSQVCQIISALDEGVAAGLSGGGKLTFIERITDSKNCCQAKFVFTSMKPLVSQNGV